MKIITIVLTALVLASAAFARQLGRPQDGFYPGQPTDERAGRVNDRVDGRADKDEGIPSTQGDATTMRSLIDQGAFPNTPNEAQAADRMQRPGV